MSEYGDDHIVQFSMYGYTVRSIRILRLVFTRMSEKSSSRLHNLKAAIGIILFGIISIVFYEVQ